MMILDSLGKPPRSLVNKDKHRQGGSMEIEVFIGFKFVRKPKTKKVTVALESEQ